MTNEEIIAIAHSSAALTFQSVDYYPKNWNTRVPLKVRMKETVMPEMPMVFTPKDGTICIKDNQYYVWVNSYGAISAILENSERLGLKPNEFEIIEWHP